MAEDSKVELPTAGDDVSEEQIMKLMGNPILENVLESRLPVDTVICCSDGRIGAHRIVLAAASPFLGIMLEDHKPGEVAVILLPDVAKSVMEILLNLAYTGRMIFPPEKENDVFAAMECLLFGQLAKLDMSMVTVKAPPPPPPPVPVPNTSRLAVSSSSRSGQPQMTDFFTPSSSSERKRRLTGSSDDVKAKLLKKPRYDKYGRRIQVALRTGVSVGKEELAKLRKKEERRIIRAGLNICKPPFLKSDPDTNTIRVNATRMPFASIRLRRLSEFVCIDIHAKKQWPENKHENRGSEKGSESTDMKPNRNNKQEKTVRITEKSQTEHSPELPVPSPEIVAVSETCSNEDVESGFMEETPPSSTTGAAENDKDRGKETDSIHENDYMACSDSDRSDYDSNGKSSITVKVT